MSRGCWRHCCPWRGWKRPVLCPATLAGHPKPQPGQADGDSSPGVLDQGQVLVTHTLHPEHPAGRQRGRAGRQRMCAGYLWRVAAGQCFQTKNCS